ncbi:MAG: rhomboid family intramembrane serine protease [Bacteroidota bacterium]
MLQSIWDDVRREFSFGNMINKIIIVNVAVFLVVNIFWMIMMVSNGWPAVYPKFYEQVVDFFSGSESGWFMLTHPWTIITYMFLHEGFLHVLFNMLYLFWFGRIFGDLLGDRRVLPLYIAGGVAGFVAFFITFNLFSLGNGSLPVLGASGAVFAILCATGSFAPDYGIRLLFFGTVRLKWIVFFAVMVEIIRLGYSDNLGGTIAHIGGIVFGFLYVFYLRRGTDLTTPRQ